MAKAFKNKNKYIYIYGSKLAQSFSKTTKSRHSLYDAPLISGLYSRLALKHGGRVGESRREGHFSFNGENYFYCEVKESCSFPSLHFVGNYLTKFQSRFISCKPLLAARFLKEPCAVQKLLPCVLMCNLLLNVIQYAEFISVVERLSVQFIANFFKSNAWVFHLVVNGSPPTSENFRRLSERFRKCRRCSDNERALPKLFKRWQ